jgi:hypothetical protein
MQALKPDSAGGCQYPILVLLGGHGTAKSTTLEMLRELVDPAVVMHEHTFKDTRDVYIECAASWILAMDNLSTLPEWLSDTLCRLATGGGFKTRKLFTGREQEIFKGKRPTIMNGISDVATKTDILSRALLVDLPVIKESERKYLEELWAEFHKHQPAIMGALYDAMAVGLQRIDAVDLDGYMTRMPDFDRWAVATEEALGMEAGNFIKARSGSMENATETALEVEPIWRALYELATDHEPGDTWQGTMKDLLRELNAAEHDEALKRSKDWPKTERKLSDIVKRIKPALLELGIHVDKLTGSRREGRRYELYYVEPTD